MTKCNSKNTIYSLLFHVVKAFGLSLVIFVFLYIFLWSNTINSSNFWFFFGINLLYSMSLYFANSYLINYLDKILPWDKQPAKRLFYGVTSALVVSAIIILLINSIQVSVFTNHSVPEYLKNIKFSDFKMPIYVTVVTLLLFYSFFFYKELQKTKLNEAKLQAENTMSKYIALKDQIDPHFLFNNLNVLYSLIDENIINAKKFVKNLSMIYRYILENKEFELTSLDTEIDFATKYLELLKFRFEESLRFKINIKDKDKKIVPLSTQIALENAIKHNKITDAHPLNIEIFEEDNYLIIKNNLNLKNSSDNSLNTGIHSLNERYKFIMKKELEIIKTDKDFIIKLPIS